MIVVPAATPKPIVERLNSELREIVTDPAVVSEWGKRGVVAQVSAPPAELAVFVRAEIVRWAEIVKQAGAAGIE
jgi:tripartite-type tricarboxylate transporter receptor subunit TctC